MTRRHDQMVRVIEKFEQELPKIKPMTDNLVVISNLCLLQAKINVHFLEGSFAEGVSLATQVDDFLKEYGRSVDEHYRMLLSYKIACMYFGNGDYKKCISYLHTIISIPNPQFRRDLQVFARILHLIASYEAGDVYSLEYQIKNGEGQRYALGTTRDHHVPEANSAHVCFGFQGRADPAVRAPEAVREPSARTQAVFLPRYYFVVGEQDRKYPDRRDHSTEIPG